MRYKVYKATEPVCITGLLEVDVWKPVPEGLLRYTLRPGPVTFGGYLSLSSSETITGQCKCPTSSHLYHCSHPVDIQGQSVLVGERSIGLEVWLDPMDSLSHP